MRALQTLAQNTPNSIIQIFKFALVGLTGTAVQYATLWLGVYLYGEATATTFSAIGFTLGAFVNHHFNRVFTFTTSKSYLTTLTQFMISAAWLFAINLGLMYGLTAFTEIHYMVCQLITTAVVFFTNFAISKLLVFKH